MGFSEEQKALIKEIAGEVGDKVSENINENLDMRFQLHQAKCPYGKMLIKSKWMTVGIIIASMSVGTVGGIGIDKILKFFAI